MQNFQVDVFQLLAARAAVKLEMAGMRHSSGRSARKYWAKVLGLPSNATHNAVMAEITKLLDVPEKREVESAS